MTENIQEKYKMVITADGVTSTDERFTMDNLNLGDNYKPLDTYFESEAGEIIRRNYAKGERRNTNQTILRLACQIYEKQITALSVEEREAFPTCQYQKDSELICGIFTSVEAFKAYRNTIEFCIYRYGEGRQLVIYCWNIFSPIIFVQECLKRFGNPGDKFILSYREKDEKEAAQSLNENLATEDATQKSDGYRNQYSEILIESKNIIFHGAPGTGKTYLAKEIAADIVSDGYFDDFNLLSDEQKEQVAFVQFHPSYDYTDFVEGLRPIVNDDGTMGFELQDGVFKQFVDRAKKNYEDSLKSKETIEKESTVEELMTSFFSNIEFGKDTFRTISGTEFQIAAIDDAFIRVAVPSNPIVNRVSVSVDILRRMLESDETFDMVADITSFLGKNTTQQAYSYCLALYKEMEKLRGSVAQVKATSQELKKYIFIIDEINRGEISKIFGELFFAIDPGYRGRAGEVATQYANMHKDPAEKFYIPENVYIIGTMNDIDRSVDSFDFAMRRRFRFIELKADERLEMLAQLEDEFLVEEAISRMSALNKEIADVEELNENYQIGASYFLKLKALTFDQLWTDYLRPLLQEYVNGMYDEDAIMNRFAKAYGYDDNLSGDEDETA